MQPVARYLGIVLLLTVTAGAVGCTPTAPDSPSSALGSALQLEFYDDDYEATQALTRNSNRVVIGGRALSVRAGSPPITLESLTFLVIPSGLEVAETAVLDSVDNGPAVFNSTCGGLPFRRDRREWISHPLPGYEIASGRIFVPIAEVRTGMPEERLTIEGLRVTYRIAGRRGQFHQDFVYRMGIGPRADFLCRSAHRRGS